MKKYDLYLFDFDGTLIDSMAALEYVFSYSYNQVGIKFDKDDTLNDLRWGNKSVVLATKAFGMGIDVKDIKNVYHYAPTDRKSVLWSCATTLIFPSERSV